MSYVVIISILMIIIIALATRLFILRREINRIVEDMQALNTGDTRKKLTVTVLHQPMETLCQQINLGLEIRDKARIEAEKHEAILRGQISNISHDLRTPLTAILGYLSMLKTAPEYRDDYLAIIENRSKTLYSLIEQFYELSVMEDAHTALELIPVDVTASVTNCLLGHYSLFEAKGILPETQLPESALTIISNTQALERIFQNLMQNALKFAQQRITISLIDEGTQIVFVISNDAPQLTDEDVDRMFERFYTADLSRTAGSTGLGLYIVQRLLEKTQGHVRRVSLAKEWFTLEICFNKVLDA